MSRLTTKSRVLLCIGLLLALNHQTFSIDFDPNFGTNGRFITTFGDGADPSSAAYTVLLQSTGRIIVVGPHTQGTSPRTVGIGLVGLTGGGALDGNFGTLGKTLVWSPSHQRSPANSILLGDGTILVLHHLWESATNNRPAIARFNPNGTFDSTFDPNLDVAPNGTSPVRIAIASDGKMYALVRSGVNHYLIRLNFDGSRDPTFGVNGVKSLSLSRFGGQGGSDPRVFGLEELPDGKILLAGSYQDPAFFEGPTFVIRLDTDGNLDRRWGLQGVARMTIPDGSLMGIVMKVQPDGKVLVGGSWTFLGSRTFLARLTTRGRLDHGFGARGIVMTSFNDTNGIRGLSLVPDGKILAVGSSGDKAVPSNQRLILIKYSSAGVQETALIGSFVAGQESSGYDVVRRPDGRFVVCGLLQNATDFRSQLAVARFQE
jgi:uncharacterized delta-60 repeat protein